MLGDQDSGPYTECKISDVCHSSDFVKEISYSTVILILVPPGLRTLRSGHEVIELITLENLNLVYFKKYGGFYFILNSLPFPCSVHLI